MTRDELLESAALDAFGLLDEYESALYTRSFHHAPAAVQNEILQVQAELVSDEALMSSELPNDDLRQRVLEAVADAVQREAVHLAPLATIGRSRAVETPASRFTFAGSSQFLRAAVFVLAASLMIVLYFLSNAMSQGNRVAVLALSRDTEIQLEQLIGPTVKDYLFDPTAHSIVLKGIGAGTAQTRAVVITLENSNEAYLVIEGLPSSDKPYSLAIRHADGRSESLKSFDNTGRLSGMRIALSTVASQLKNVRWEISDAGGAVLLASA